LRNIFHNLVFFFAITVCSFSYAQKKEIDSLRRVLKVTKIDTAKVNLYNKIANRFKEIDPNSTAYFAEKATMLSKQINYKFGLANAYINSGNSNIILGNCKIATAFFTKAKVVCQAILKDDSENKQVKNGLARALASLGIVFSQEGNYYAASENYQKALKLYQEINQKNNISKAFNNIGVVYKSQGNKDKALLYFKKALAIQEQIGEQTVPVTLTNIGVIYFEQYNYKEALHYYSKAKKQFEKIDNIRGFALLNNYFGDYYQKQKDESKAITYYSLSLKMYEELQNKFGASLALYNLGQLYFDQSQEIGVLDLRLTIVDC
jgi:tetratricopeptide (TPR) repeat protein